MVLLICLNTVVCKLICFITCIRGIPVRYCKGFRLKFSFNLFCFYSGFNLFLFHFQKFMSIPLRLLFVFFSFYDAPINVKPEWGGGVILIGHHAFDLSISNSIRGVNYLFMLIWTTIFCQGVETLMSFLENVKIPTLFPDPPPSPLRLDIDRCIISFLEALWVFLFLNLECHFVESLKMW